MDAIGMYTRNRNPNSYFNARSKALLALQLNIRTLVKHTSYSGYARMIDSFTKTTEGSIRNTLVNKRDPELVSMVIQLMVDTLRRMTTARENRRRVMAIRIQRWWLKRMYSPGQSGFKLAQTEFDTLKNH